MSIANLSRAFKIRSGIQIILGGHAVVAGLGLYTGNESFYENIVMPSCRFLDAETAHRLAILAVKYNLVPKMKVENDSSLKVDLFGYTFPNPLGLAAGFDKHAEGVDGFFSMGFGAVEVGSVTPKPQSGNPKPRVFRLTKDRGVINRYGFNSDGHEVVLERLKHRHDKTQTEKNKSSNETNSNGSNVIPTRKSGIIGVNLGKNKDSVDGVGDFVEGVKKFSNVADYLVMNISSPNTPGLRGMQARQQLQQLIDKVVSSRSSLPIEEQKPIIIKISPDLSEKEKIDIASILSKSNCGIDGIIVSNTTISRPDSLHQNSNVKESGGLSGKPLKDLSTKCIKDMYRLTHGRIPIIGVGGIENGRDAFDKICAGASMVQILTSFTYSGPPIVTKIKRELKEILKNEGYQNVSEAVGADFKTSR